MKIYIAHSTGFDYKNELYKPILESDFYNENIILPHLNSGQQFNSKGFFLNGCDLVIAEVSLASTGMGIELGWVNDLNIPVVCIYKKGSKYSGALHAVSRKFIEYSDAEELKDKLKTIFSV